MDSSRCKSGRFRIRTGIDIEDLDRWRRPLALLRRPGRVFSAEEIAWCRRQRDPVPHFAVRWCAREAVIKALAPLCRLSVTHLVTLRTSTAGLSIQRRDGQPWPDCVVDLAVSVSHTRTTAAATATVLYVE